MRCKLKAALTFLAHTEILLVQAVESTSGSCELVVEDRVDGPLQAACPAVPAGESFRSRWKGRGGNTRSTAAVCALPVMVPLMY